MPWDGSGNVTRTNGTNSGTTVWQDDRDDGVNIRADRHDTHDEDLANALKNTVALDGQTTTTTDNSLLWYHGTNNRFEGFSVAASRIVGRDGTNDVGALTAETAQRILGDDEHATDDGTDAYVSATTTSAPASGVRIYRDFQSANTTTTPTLDSLTITTKDGSAMWSGALSGVHTLQLASGGGSWLALDPNPIDEDDMASDSDAAAPTQQSVKAFAAQIATGTYTGDGASEQSITGLGFQPKYLKIWPRATSGGTSDTHFETTDTMVDDHSNGLAFTHEAAGSHVFRTDRIISLDADGFTVDDRGSDGDPNANGVDYNYMAIG